MIGMHHTTLHREVKVETHVTFFVSPFGQLSTIYCRTTGAKSVFVCWLVGYVDSYSS